MKILYGVQGTGNGHITRARVMAKALSEAGIEVDWVFSGRPDNDYFDMDCFGDYRTFRGLTFVIEHGKINHLKTARQLHFNQLRKDIKSIDLSEYDLILNDFEPVTAWAARMQKRFSIGLSHQCSFRYAIPKKGNNIITDLVMRWFAPVSLPIGVHWHHFNANILPPIIDTHPTSDIQHNHILVYFPFQSLNELIRLVEPFTDFHFYIYHAIKAPEDRGHIHLRPFSRAGFQKDLQKTSGVICGAGFELPSEAIQLGKKLLVQPVGGQMEQLSNALALQQLGLASVTQSFSHHNLREWLSKSPDKQVEYPDTANSVVNWLKQGQWSDSTHLVQQLWHQTFPKRNVEQDENCAFFSR